MPDPVPQCKPAPLSPSLSATGVGFVLVIDRRQDRWAAVKGTLLRIAVSFILWCFMLLDMFVCLPPGPCMECRLYGLCVRRLYAGCQINHSNQVCWQSTFINSQRRLHAVHVYASRLQQTNKHRIHIQRQSTPFKC